MRCNLYMFVGFFLRMAASYRSIHELNDTGNCTGEFRSGNSEWTPHHYSISLKLSPEEQTFEGVVDIWGRQNSSFSDGIDLHSVNLTVWKIFMDGIEMNAQNWYMDSTEGLLRIINLPISTSYSNLRIHYEGRFHEAGGIIKQIYNETDSNRWIIFSFLQPTFARTVFPCIDLPKYKATFDVSISNPGPGRIVLSNMPQKSSDSKMIKFERTPRMSTYLLAFVVCDYVPVRWPGESRNITTWVPKEMATKKETLWVTQLTSKFLNALEKYTGNAFSLAKLDQFVVNDKPGIGGMENWGLIMYQIDSFLPADPTVANQFAVVYSIAHELSHHWFGNSVTTADWCGMWFQEAIPTFFHGLIPSQIIVETDMVNKVKWMARKSVMDNECFFIDFIAPLRDEEDPRVSQQQLFSLTRYLKGASVFYMIESIVRPNIFQESLRSFIKKYNYSFANEFELWNEVVAQDGLNKFDNPSFDEVLHTWVTMRGHPIVFLERDENGALKAGQRTCLWKLTMYSEWWIPITYTTNSSRPDFNDTSLKRWIAPFDEVEMLNITLKNDEWIVMNILGSGFYRVEYDPITWKLLVDQLKRDHELIPPINRAMLVDDSFHTANTGEKLVRAFEIMEYLPKEENALVWEALLINIEWHYKGAPKKEKVKLQNYLRYLLKTVFMKAVQNTVSTWMTPLKTRTDFLYERSLMGTVYELSYMMGLKNCSRFSIHIANEVIKGNLNETNIPRDIRQNLWCAAVERGPEDIFLHVKTIFELEKNEMRKAQLFEQLLCSRSHTRSLLALESQLSKEFGDNVQNPPQLCKNRVEEIFNITLPSEQYLEDDRLWLEVYGTEPLHWLTKFFLTKKKNA